MKSPYEILFGKSPSYSHLRVFCCLCYVHTHDRIRDKFDACAVRCMFIGYPSGQKGWRMFNLERGHVVVSRDVVFYEDIYPFATSSSPSSHTSPPTRLSQGSLHLGPNSSNPTIDILHTGEPTEIPHSNSAGPIEPTPPRLPDTLALTEPDTTDPISLP